MSNVKLSHEEQQECTGWSSHRLEAPFSIGHLISYIYTLSGIRCACLNWTLITCTCLHLISTWQGLWLRMDIKKGRVMISLGRAFQTMCIILGSAVYTIGKGLCDCFKRIENIRELLTSSSFLHLNFGFLAFETTIFMIHNCWPDETIRDPIQIPKSLCRVKSAHRRHAWYLLATLVGKEWIPRKTCVTMKSDFVLIIQELF